MIIKYKFNKINYEIHNPTLKGNLVIILSDISMDRG